MFHLLFRVILVMIRHTGRPSSQLVSFDIDMLFSTGTGGSRGREVVDHATATIVEGQMGARHGVSRTGGGACPSVRGGVDRIVKVVSICN